MMNKLTTTFLIAGFLFLSQGAIAQRSLPIIDMHLHSIDVDANGSLPNGINRGAPDFPDFDPEKPWVETALNWLQNPGRENPIMSPTTNEELRDQTLEVLKRRNIYGVTSGSWLDDYIEHGEKYIIPSLSPMGRIDNWPSPEDLREMLETENTKSSVK